MSNSTFSMTVEGQDKLGIEVLMSGMVVTPSYAMWTVTNATREMSKIFLQTSLAQGLAGMFAFSAIMLTGWQVGLRFW